MKYIWIMSLVVSFLHIEPVEAKETMPFSGKSYIVMEAGSQQVLEGKNEHYVQSVASISKIMTCIVAIENKALDTKVTVDETIKKAWGSGIYIHIGDVITLQDLLYGLMLRSGNDAAVMIGASVSGSVDAFVEKMNEKAADLEMEHTTFSNPTGLDEEDAGNQSCVHDMAKLMAYCHQNPIFNEIVNTKVYKRQDGNGSWHNKNRLLEEYEYCIGGKTGFTKKAKRTLVTMASKDGVDLIVVTFNCGNDFEFHKSKYEEYYQLYKNTIILNRGIINYKDQKYILDLDVYLKKMDQDNVDVSIKNNQVFVKINDQMVLKKEVQPFSLLGCMKMVFKDLMHV